MAVRQYDTKEEWAADGNNFAGASDASRILGIEDGAAVLWGVKNGIMEPWEGNEAAEWGLRLEGPICEAYSEKFNCDVGIPKQWTRYISDECPWMACTPDAFTDDDHHIQIKNFGKYVKYDFENWGKTREKVEVQVQHELSVLEADKAYIVVLWGGNELQRYECVRHEKMIALIREKTKEFMERVASGEIPEVDGSIPCAKLLAKLHPDDNGEEVALPEECGEMAEMLSKLKDTAKVNEKSIRTLENKLKAAIGDATYGVLPDGTRFSLKTQERAGYEVKPNKFRTLRRLKK